MTDGILLGQLRALVEVARLGSLGRAAEALFLTQPALTARLKRLERELGTSLLARDRKGARLTDSGRAFLSYAERIIAMANEGQRVVNEVRRNVTGELVVATTQPISTYLLPPVIREFVRRNPSVRLTVRSSSPEQVLQAVRAGEAHLGLGRATQDPEIESLPLYVERFVLVVGSTHRLANVSPVPVQELSHEMFVVLYRNPSFDDFIQSLLNHSGVLPRSVIDLSDAEAAKWMVRDGIAVGVFGHFIVARELGDGSLREIKIEGVPPVLRTVAALRLRRATEVSLAIEFLALLKAHVSESHLTTASEHKVRRTATSVRQSA